MIYSVYGLKNRLSGVFERPITEKYDIKEYPELLRQSLALADIEKLNIHKEYDLYFLGTFDSISGSITSSSCEFVMSLEQLCNDYIARKGGEVNGKEGA